LARAGLRCDPKPSGPPLRPLAGGAQGPPGPPGRPPLRLIVGGRASEVRGQASVELVVLLPLILVIVAVAWQALLAGQTVWEARVAARAAARANAFGADAAAAARAHLPAKLERGLKVDAESDGDVRVSLRVPTVLPSIRLGRVAATSHFRPQGG
jgi:hypothetical protein